MPRMTASRHGAAVKIQRQPHGSPEQCRVVARTLVSQKRMLRIHLMPFVARIYFLQSRANHLPSGIGDMRILLPPDEHDFGLQVRDALQAAIRPAFFKRA